MQSEIWELPSDIINPKSQRNCLHILRSNFHYKIKACISVSKCKYVCRIHIHIIPSSPSCLSPRQTVLTQTPPTHVTTFNPDASRRGSPNWQSTHTRTGAAYWKWFPATALLVSSARAESRRFRRKMNEFPLFNTRDLGSPKLWTTFISKTCTRCGN